MRSEAECSSPVFGALSGVERSGGFFVPIEMAIQKTVPVFSASLQLPSHFKANALVVSLPRFLGKHLRSERINRK